MLAAMSYPLPQGAGQFCSAVPSRSCSKTEEAAKEDNTPQESAQKRLMHIMAFKKKKQRAIQICQFHTFDTVIEERKEIGGNQRHALS